MQCFKPGHVHYNAEKKRPVTVKPCSRAGVFDQNMNLLLYMLDNTPNAAIVANMELPP